MSDSNRIRYIPLNELKKPKNNHEVMVDYYWHIIDGCAMAYHRYGPKDKSAGVPQCNGNPEVAKMIQERIYPDAIVVQIPVAYWPIDYEGY